MIFVVDNFFEPQEFKMVVDEVKKLQFFSDVDDKINEEMDESGKDYKGLKPSKYPGSRTDALAVVNPLLASFVLNKIEKTGVPFANNGYNWSSTQHAYLRLEGDNKGEYIHQDQCDWVFVIYLSATNLDSGTKVYLSTENVGKNAFEENLQADETAFVRFVQNRAFMFSPASTPHMAWNNHGKDITDGRLTINGFNCYV